MILARAIQQLLRRGAALMLLITVAPALAQDASCPPQPAAPSPESLQAQFRDAKDRGLLWKIEKAGRSGYLFGSLHVGKQEWAIPGPKTRAALLASDIVALELDILDPAIQAQMADPARLGIKSFELPKPLKARMEAIARRVCAPMPQFGSLHPMMQLVTLTLLDARFGGFEVGYGSEIFLAGFARGAKKTVASLESAELQLRLLLDGDPKEIIASMGRALALFESGKGRSVLERMTRAWAEGNLKDLEDYAQWCECAVTAEERRAMQKLNDERNPGLAEGIDRLLAGDKTVFAAVGALHMIGPQGLPRLLAQMGYKVERVEF
jgi:uncharacterized protein YbaP (TraB family)